MAIHPHLVTTAVLCVAVASCATTTYAGPASSEDRISNAMEQPFRDINWMREEPPEILKQAVLDPYRLPDDVACDVLQSEVAVLDLLLGPDVDARDVMDDADGGAGGLAIDAVSDLFGLPFRGVFRWISGADERDEVLAAAILSGMARRSFLKGAARSSGCTHPPDPEPELR